MRFVFGATSANSREEACSSTRRFCAARVALVRAKNLKKTF